MTATPGAAQPTHPERPGRSEGVASEFSVFTKIKPGHTEALRALLADIEGKSAGEGNRGAIRQIGTLLDTPEFRPALENPANAELVATPAFQRLLELAAS
ncbi:hypothetical protein AB9Q10_43915 [Streptomyces krungchingensis]|uniref:hypothetical protein n=1 Tax=Streptomyces krungchingensis TaxID=1565034 RepID=UPI003CF4C584